MYQNTESLNFRVGKFVTLKVCERDSLSAKREVAAYEHLNSMKTTHQGALLVRELCDHFQIPDLNGTHICLTQEPLGMSLETLRQLMPEKQLSADVLKAVLKHLLLALDFLHTEAKMVHTGDDACNSDNDLELKLIREQIFKQGTFIFASRILLF